MNERGIPMSGTPPLAHGRHTVRTWLVDTMVKGTEGIEATHVVHDHGALIFTDARIPGAPVVRIVARDDWSRCVLDR